MATLVRRVTAFSESTADALATELEDFLPAVSLIENLSTHSDGSDHVAILVHWAEPAPDEE